jgi:hypothetical protein
MRETVLPRVSDTVYSAIVASEPARREAYVRGTAAMAALKGQAPLSDLATVTRSPARRARGAEPLRTWLLTAMGLTAVVVLGRKIWQRQNASHRYVEDSSLMTEPASDPAIDISTSTQVRPETRFGR